MWPFNAKTRWIAVALAPLPMFAADCCKNSVAIVASLSGSATVQSPGSREKAPISSLDWLSDGATLEVGTGSRAVLILSNGRRYELGQGAKATFTADGGPKVTGVVRELPALPPIPKPATVAADSAPTSGAPRVRGEKDISGYLYPRAGTVALADKLTLRYNSVPEATSYRVALEDDGGASLLNVTTESTEVPVPAGSIEAGARYHWQVRAMRSGTAIGVGMAEFTALSAENALQRTEFASALGATGEDPATLALLADVDLRLGLIAEACDEFSAALRKKPDDATLRRVLESARASLAGQGR